MSAIPWPEEGPEVDVWNHIQTGLDLADEELACLPKDLRKFAEAVAAALLDNRRRVILNAKERGWVELDSTLLEQPWIRYAADLAIAGEGIGRATQGLDRYAEIKPAAARHSLPSKASTYITEIAHTYIFGFDPACIALCRAALEQLLRERLVAIGAYTERGLKKDRPTAGTLLEKAKQRDLLPRFYDAAKRVIKRGDELMHSHIADHKVLKTLAADSITDFTTAAVELLGGKPTFD